MNYKKIHELKKRIEAVLCGSGKINDYSGQVMTEAIIQVLLEEGLLAAAEPVSGPKKKKNS